MYKYPNRPSHIDDLTNFIATKIGPAWYYEAYDQLDGDILLLVSTKKYDRIMIHDTPFGLKSDPDDLKSYLTFHNRDYPVHRAKPLWSDLPVIEIFEVADPNKHYHSDGNDDWTILTYPDGTRKKVRQMRRYTSR
jgi:hypothetical protein